MSTTDMKLLLIIFAAALFCLGIYTLLVMGRRKHPGLSDLRGWAYAHRGLHGQGRPENSMAAFRAALEQGYGIELDVHLLADGNLSVIHDSSLKRTTGTDRQIEELTTDELKTVFLEGTLQTVPTLQEVLQLFDGKAPLIVELKTAGNNHAALTDAAVAQLAGYPGAYCLESFDPRCIGYLKKHYPKLIRGQLAENFLPVKSRVPWLLRFLMTHQMLNFLTRPDFVAYRFEHRKTLGNFLARKLWGVQGVAWTLQSSEDHKTAVKEGWIPIFEGYKP